MLSAVWAAPGGVGRVRWRVREGDLALMVEGDAAQLFDLSQDPDQERDVAAERPQDVARLLAQVPEEAPVGPIVEVNEARREALRALGYLD